MIKRTKLQAAEVRLAFAIIFNSDLIRDHLQEITILENIGKTYLTKESLNVIISPAQEAWEEWKENNNQTGALDLVLDVSGRMDQRGAKGQASLEFNFDMLIPGNSFHLETKNDSTGPQPNRITDLILNRINTSHSNDFKFQLDVFFPEAEQLIFVYYVKGGTKQDGHEAYDRMGTPWAFPEEKWFLYKTLSHYVITFYQNLVPRVPVNR